MPVRGDFVLLAHVFSIRAERAQDQNVFRRRIQPHAIAFEKPNAVLFVRRPREWQRG